MYTGEKQQQQQQLTKGEKQACRRRMVLADSPEVPALAETAICRWRADVEDMPQDNSLSFRELIAGVQKGSCRMRS